ncbi:hypothetical protein ACINKY_07660 [Paenibacillus illinoisensis]|uniref:Uncharacterized protein n=1 Tax=Paenibacillus illinoisensis TaxID=59845 RepID=A0ABW8HQZ6_9BACL
MRLWISGKSQTCCRQLFNTFGSSGVRKQAIKLYLCTDLQGYYEKNDWTYIGKGYLLDNEETRIYELQF